MSHRTATAISSPNIAFIKYWGIKHPELNIPANGSISMNLEGLTTRTQVTLDASLPCDRLEINGKPVSGESLERVSCLLDYVRRMAGIQEYASVSSENNFPAGAGLASSASAFAALSLAASAAAGLELPEKELSRLARLGSGSACRSIPGGFVEWQAGESDEDSYAFSIAPADYWDLVDCIAILSEAHKRVGSAEGHSLAASSPLQAARVLDAPRRIDLCRKAILERDFEAFAAVVEQDCNLMHAVMMTSRPPLFYWQPVTLSVIQRVLEWRREGLPVCYTIDAGPNVHVLTLASYASEVAEKLQHIPGVERTISAPPGGPAKLL